MPINPVFHRYVRPSITTNTMKITHRLSIGILSAIVLAAANPSAQAQNSYKFIFGGSAGIRLDANHAGESLFNQHRLRL